MALSLKGNVVPRKVNLPELLAILAEDRKMPS